MSPVLPPPVSGEMVHHLVQPCLGVLGGVEFSEGEDERVLDDVSGVFHGEALLANRPPDQGQKELTVEGFELRGVRFPRDRRRLGARLPLRLRQGRPSLCLKVESLSPYCHDPEVSPAQWESLEIARQSGAGESLSCGCAPGQRPWKEGEETVRRCLESFDLFRDSPVLVRVPQEVCRGICSEQAVHLAKKLEPLAEPCRYQKGLSRSWPGGARGARGGRSDLSCGAGRTRGEEPRRQSPPAPSSLPRS